MRNELIAKTICEMVNAGACGEGASLGDAVDVLRMVREYIDRRLATLIEEQQADRLARQR